MAGRNDDHLKPAKPSGSAPPKRKLRFSENTGAAGFGCLRSPESTDCATRAFCVGDPGNAKEPEFWCRLTPKAILNSFR